MLTPEMIDILNREIEDGYGSPLNLAIELDKVVEMLFYVDEETFDRLKIQRAVGAINTVKNVLMLPVPD